MKINHEQKSKIQPEDCGDGLFYVGINQQGLYMYEKEIDGKKIIFGINPVWRDSYIDALADASIRNKVEANKNYIESLKNPKKESFNYNNEVSVKDALNRMEDIVSKTR